MWSLLYIIIQLPYLRNLGLNFRILWINIQRVKTYQWLHLYWQYTVWHTHEKSLGHFNSYLYNDIGLMESWVEGPSLSCFMSFLLPPSCPPCNPTSREKEQRARQTSGREPLTAPLPDKSEGYRWRSRVSPSSKLPPSSVWMYFGCQWGAPKIVICMGVPLNRGVAWIEMVLPLVIHIFVR